MPEIGVKRERKFRLKVFHCGMVNPKQFGFTVAVNKWTWCCSGLTSITIGGTTVSGEDMILQ